jgi:sterol desaturase/sphingolipid hydroxylase (fatty acid hydroxylase superfamily)
MSHPEISRSKEPIRLFKSDWLEFFTHIHPAVVAGLWAPVVAWFLWTGVRDRSHSAWPGVTFLLVAFLVGAFLWTWAEYMLHRFLFHFPPRTEWQKRVSFVMHGVHHAQPRSKTRLVMPPAVSVPLAALFYGLFRLVVGVAFGSPHWVGPLFAGFIAGYLAYDMFHYAMHHAAMRRGILRAQRRHHMYHHTQTPDQRFGVSSPLWDIVFGTTGRESTNSSLEHS